MSVYNKIIDGVYNNKLIYPTRPSRPELFDVKATAMTAEQAAAFPEAHREYNAQLEQYDRDCKHYRENGGKLMDQFRSDLEAEYEMTDHPKASLLWEKAWERGHSGGFSDVYSAYADMVELVK